MDTLESPLSENTSFELPLPDTLNSSVHTADSPQQIFETPQFRRSVKNTRPPTYLNDYELSCHVPPQCQSVYQMQVGPSCSKYPISAFVTYSNLSAFHQTFTKALDQTVEPDSYDLACREEC